MEEKRIIFLKGSKVILRPLNKETDLESACRWVNDPEVRNYLTVSFPSMLVQEEKWFDNLVKKENEILLAIETLENKNLIGFMGLHKINWIDSNATTGAMIGEKEYWGKGYGTDAKMILLNYAFNRLRLHRISSSVIAFNERSLKYSLKCGYKEEGRVREKFFRNGKYWDEILLGILKKEFDPVWKKYKLENKIKESEE